MNSITPLSRYRRTDEILNTSVIPKYMVIDLTEEIQGFLASSHEMVNFEYSLDELFNEILLYLSDRAMAGQGLQSLKDEILRIHSLENGYEDGEILAAAAVGFAQALYAKFLTLGLYTPEGVLPYESVRWLDTNTPILNKFEDRHPLEGGSVRGRWQETASHSPVIAEW